MNPVKIAHISDLHVGSDSEEQWTALNTSLASYKPNLIVITGDLVDNPNEASFQRAKEKLEAIRIKCKIAENDVYVVPGNHDYRIKGLLKKTLIHPPDLSKHFGNWLRVPSGSLCFDKDKNISIFVFDSNYSPSFFTAGGKIGSQALKKFNAACDCFAKDTGFKSSTKIALLHHHPLPVIHSQQFESYLVLDDAGEFLRHLAQRGIEVVLHGHKHHQTQSHVVFQDAFGGRRSISVISCASTTKELVEREDRGYNQITIEDDGRIELTILKFKPKEGFQPDAGMPMIQPSCDSFVEKLFLKNQKEQSYTTGHFSRALTIDEEGAAFFCRYISDMRVTSPTTFRQITPPLFTTATGQLKTSNFKSFVETSELKSKW